MRSKKAIYNIITNLLLQAVAVIYGFIVPKVIISHFGSEVNGLVSSITQFLAYIALLESGFGPVVKSILYKPLAKKDSEAIANILKTSERFFRKIALVFVLYVVILCLVFPMIAGEGFDKIFTISLVMIIAVSTFAEYYFGMTYRLFLQAEQKTYVISIIQVITYILSAIAVVAMALTGCDILAIKLVSGLIFVFRPLAQNFYVKRKYNIELRNASGNYPIKQKWDGLAQHIAAVIHGNTDIAILTIFTTLTEVSVYSVYYLVISGVKRIVQSFNNGLDASFGDMIAKKEVENLRRKFSAYELLYMMVAAVVFTTTIVAITPFIGVYTWGVADADYVRPVFGCLLAVSEFIWAIRLPYSSLTLAAGHFKETRRGAWVEAIANIVVSIVLVFNFGIVGVAIGTIIAMLIRTVEFVYHANKYILKRRVSESVKKILILVASAAVVVLAIFQLVGIPEFSGYLEWVLWAAMVALVSGVMVFVTYFVLCRNDMERILGRVKKIVSRKK